MHEVEAGLVRIDLRAFLLHVVAQNFAKRLVHQVGRRVVAHGAGAGQRIDLCRHAIADFQCAGLDHAVVAEHGSLNLLRVFHGKDSVRGA